LLAIPLQFVQRTVGIDQTTTGSEYYSHQAGDRVEEPSHDRLSSLPIGRYPDRDGVGHTDGVAEW
jgi:hypothetical protein